MCVHNDHRVYDEPEYESGDSELDEEELFMKYHGMEDSLNYACSYQRALKAVLAKFEGDLTFALSEAKRSKHCAIEGVGQHTMSVDADVWHSWNAAENGCWHDKSFRDWFAKKHPETTVPYTPRKTMVGFRPSAITGICP